MNTSTISNDTLNLTSALEIIQRLVAENKQLKTENQELKKLTPKPKVISTKPKPIKSTPLKDAVVKKNTEIYNKIKNLQKYLQWYIKDYESTTEMEWLNPETYKLAFEIPENYASNQAKINVLRRQTTVLQEKYIAVLNWRKQLAEIEYDEY